MPAVNLKSHGTTRAPRAATVTSSDGATLGSGVVAPSPAVRSSNSTHDHNLRRFFLGPMPEKIVAPEIKRRRKWINREADGQDDDSDAGSFHFRRERLFQHFINEGGREEDWDEDVERGIREDMKSRWKENGWYQVWNRKGKKNQKLPGEL